MPWPRLDVCLQGVCVSPNGTYLLIGEERNNRFRKLDLVTGIITT